MRTLEHWNEERLGQRLGWKARVVCKQDGSYLVRLGSNQIVLTPCTVRWIFNGDKYSMVGVAMFWVALAWRRADQKGNPIIIHCGCGGGLGEDDHHVLAITNYREKG